MLIWEKNCLRKFVCGKCVVSLSNIKSKLCGKISNIVCDGKYMFCKDKRSIYIINVTSGKVLHTAEYCHRGDLFLEFAGENKNGPVFFDRKYSSLLYSAENKYHMHKDIIITPLVFNRKNIAAITCGEKGLGVADSLGKEILENKFDTIEVKVIISGKSTDDLKEKIIPFQTIFEKGSL